MSYKKLKNIRVKDFFLQGDDYYVFLYFTYCPHCLKIEKTVTDFVNNHPNLKFYFIKMDDDRDANYFKQTENYNNLPQDEFIKSYILDSLNKDNLDEVNYYYVPALYHIKEHKVVGIYVTEEPILNYLKSLDK